MWVGRKIYACQQRQDLCALDENMKTGDRSTDVNRDVATATNLDSDVCTLLRHLDILTDYRIHIKIR